MKSRSLPGKLIKNGAMAVNFLPFRSKIGEIEKNQEE